MVESLFWHHRNNPTNMLVLDDYDGNCVLTFMDSYREHELLSKLEVLKHHVRKQGLTTHDVKSTPAKANSELAVAFDMDRRQPQGSHGIGTSRRNIPVPIGRV